MKQKIILLLTAILLFCQPAWAAGKVVVAVSQIVEHPALDACRKGLLEGLKDAGYVEGYNLEFKFQTAQGNPTTATQIAKQFVGEAPDVLVGIATPSAQALAAATKEIPIVFSAVTDPVGAKLLSNMKKPEGNVTGLSDLSPVAQHVDTMLKIFPDMKNIGVVYNPGEANSVSLVKLLKKTAAARKLNVIEGTATRTSEVQVAAQTVAPKSDVVYALTDNTIASAIAALISTANAAKTPVFGAETSYVDSGAIIAVGFDYYQIGYQTADYVIKILGDMKPSEMPARVAKGTDIVINLKAAKELGIDFPQVLLNKATRVVK